MQIELVKENGTTVECLGLKSQRILAIDKLVAEMHASNKTYSIADVIKTVGDKFDPTQNEWFAFFFRMGMAKALGRFHRIYV